MTNVSVRKKILYFKGVQLLFIFYNLHRTCFTFFRYESDGRTFFEEAKLRDHEFDFSCEFIHEIELMKEFSVILLFTTFEVLGLDISDMHLMDDFVLFDDYLLAEIAATSLIIELMLDLVAGRFDSLREVRIDDTF